MRSVRRRLGTLLRAVVRRAVITASLSVGQRAHVGPPMLRSAPEATKSSGSAVGASTRVGSVSPPGPPAIEMMEYCARSRVPSRTIASRARAWALRRVPEG